MTTGLSANVDIGLQTDVMQWALHLVLWVQTLLPRKRTYPLLFLFLSSLII